MPKANKHLQQIHEAATEAPNILTVRIGGTSYTITGAYVGLVASESQAALIIEDQTLILDLDRAGSMKNAKFVKSPDHASVAKALLPAPEPPAEAQAALDMLSKLEGFKLTFDNKGRPTLVADSSKTASKGTTATGAPRQRAPRGTATPKATKPAIVKGLKVTRNKTGIEHTVTGIDSATGMVTLKPADGTEDYKTKGLRGNGSTAPVPVFWANWQEVA